MHQSHIHGLWSNLLRHQETSRAHPIIQAIYELLYQFSNRTKDNQVLLDKYIRMWDRDSKEQTRHSEFLLREKATQVFGKESNDPEFF